MAELTNSLLLRCPLEEVKGRIQGALHRAAERVPVGPQPNRLCPRWQLIRRRDQPRLGFARRTTHGLQRVVYTGKVPFEILSMNITADGWDVKFTQPVDPAEIVKPEHWFLESYTYHYWDTYGSPRDRSDRKTRFRQSAWPRTG